MENGEWFDMDEANEKLNKDINGGTYKTSKEAINSEASDEFFRRKTLENKMLNMNDIYETKESLREKAKQNIQFRLDRRKIEEKSATRKHVYFPALKEKLNNIIDSALKTDRTSFKGIVIAVGLVLALGGNAVYAGYQLESFENHTGGATKEQEYTPENNESVEEKTPEQLAADLAKKDSLSNEEVKYIKEVNNGEYNKPLVSDQFSTEKTHTTPVSEYEEEKHVMTWPAIEGEEGYTPLSKDPNYNPPTEEDIIRLQEEAKNLASK